MPTTWYTSSGISNVGVAAACAQPGAVGWAWQILRDGSRHSLMGTLSSGPPTPCFAPGQGGDWGPLSSQESRASRPLHLGSPVSCGIVGCMCFRRRGAREGTVLSFSWSTSLSSLSSILGVCCCDQSIQQEPPAGGEVCLGSGFPRFILWSAGSKADRRGEGCGRGELSAGGSGGALRERRALARHSQGGWLPPARLHLESPTQPSGGLIHTWIDLPSSHSPVIQPCLPGVPLSLGGHRAPNTGALGAAPRARSAPPRAHSPQLCGLVPPAGLGVAGGPACSKARPGPGRVVEGRVGDLVQPWRGCTLAAGAVAGLHTQVQWPRWPSPARGPPECAAALGLGCGGGSTSSAAPGLWGPQSHLTGPFVK